MSNGQTEESSRTQLKSRNLEEINFHTASTAFHSANISARSSYPNCQNSNSGSYPSRQIGSGKQGPDVLAIVNYQYNVFFSEYAASSLVVQLSDEKRAVSGNPYVFLVFI